MVYGKKEVVYRGTCEGEIAYEMSGASGFGYDPLFLPQAHSNISMAELSMEQKNQISHRGNAFIHLSSTISTLLQ